MLYYDRIDVSEGIDVVSQVHLKNALFVAVGIFK